jgi:hypothetical protein
VAARWPTRARPQYANPLLDQLDVGNVVRKRLFRESCVYHDVRARARSRRCSRCLLSARAPCVVVFVRASAISFNLAG